MIITYVIKTLKTIIQFQYFLRLLLPAGNDLTFQFDWVNGNSTSIDTGS